MTSATEEATAPQRDPGLVPACTRFAAGVEYDGGRFFGWQIQPDRVTVQKVLEAALSDFVGRPIRVTTAGRTDTGVHALNQVVHFDTDVTRSPQSWLRGVNTYLPPGVALLWTQAVPPEFNARFSAFARSYDYVLYVAPVAPALLASKVGWVPKPLDVAAMRAAAARLIGEHDFSSFRSSQCQAKTPVKTLYAVDIAENGAFVHFRFTASAFLHHMVRNVMGMLVAIGKGRFPPEWATQLLGERDRRAAAPTFMADGLYLTRVGYPSAFALPAASVAARPGNFRWPDEDAAGLVAPRFPAG